MNTYNLLEVANVHEGNFDYLIELIKEFSDVSEAQGFKVQVLKADKIALPDYSYYGIYKELTFSEEQWKEIIDEIVKTKHCWIDVFDDFSIQITEQNLDKIYGIKLQASILSNKSILKKLGQIDMSDKQMIINIAGMSILQIYEIIREVSEKVSPDKIILQIGFQGYPTELIDSGLSKIAVIKENFDNEISFTDHIDASDIDSLWLPVFSVLSGATLIEKHIKLTGSNPKYDYFSAVEKEKYVQYLDNLKKYTDLLIQPFINENEIKYLEGTLQIPIIKGEKKAGQTISMEKDLEFRRTNSMGITINELSVLIKNFSVLSKDKEKNTVIFKEDLHKATIATIIACRMKSSRLTEKAIKKIGDLSSVELCIKNCLKFENVFR